MTNTDEIKNQTIGLAHLHQHHLEQMKVGLIQILLPLFEQLNIKTISWTQYTPYWNDGDECRFRRSEAEADGEYNETVDEILEELPNSFYEMIFPNHSEITIESDGTIGINEFDHE